MPRLRSSHRRGGVPARLPPRCDLVTSSLRLQGCPRLPSSPNAHGTSDFRLSGWACQTEGAPWAGLGARRRSSAPPERGSDFGALIPFGVPVNPTSRSAFLGALGGFSCISSLARPRHLLWTVSWWVSRPLWPLPPSVCEHTHPGCPVRFQKLILIPTTLGCGSPTGFCFPHEPHP